MEFVHRELQLLNQLSLNSLKVLFLLLQYGLGTTELREVSRNYKYGDGALSMACEAVLSESDCKFIPFVLITIKYAFVFCAVSNDLLIVSIGERIVSNIFS